MQKAIAGLMAAWLSGFVFLFCCGDTVKAAEVEFCPMPKPAHHCDTADQQNTRSDAVSSAKGVCLDCCALVPVVFDKARKVDQPRLPLTVPENARTLVRYIRPRLTRTVGLLHSYHSRLPDRSQTFISNRVFRI